MSNVIKFEYTLPNTSQKVIGVKRLADAHENRAEGNPEAPGLDVEVEDKRKAAESLLQQAKKDAEQLKNEALIYYDQQVQQIERMKEQWVDEKAHLEDETVKRAFNEGFQKGQAAANEQFQSMIKEAKHILSIAKAEQEKQVKQSEHIILQLALTSAEKIVKQSLSENDEAYMNIVKAAINEAKDHRDVQLKVDPYHFEHVMNFKEELSKIINGNRAIMIYPEEELRDGGCVIESSFGKVDASVDSQLHEIKQKLTALMEEEADENR